MLDPVGTICEDWQADTDRTTLLGVQQVRVLKHMANGPYNPLSEYPTEKSPIGVKEAEAQTQTPRPYKVILHNDEVNEMDYVVEVICKLTPLSTQDAYRKMMEAHLTGRSVLLVTHKERAELYRDQFHSCRLAVTIEPD